MPLPLHPPEEPEGDVAGPAGDVEEPHPRPGREPVEHRVLPEPVDPEAHRVVHQVVVRGDRAEDALDARRLLPLAHGLVAEVGGALVGHAARAFRRFRRLL